MGVLHHIKRLLQSAKEFGEGELGAEAPAKPRAPPSGRPPRPPAKAGRRATSEHSETTPPTTGPQASHRSKQELTRLRGQFALLEQQLGALPARVPTHVKEQLLDKLSACQPAAEAESMGAAPHGGKQAAIGAVAGPGAQHLPGVAASEDSKPGALSKLSKLARQRQPQAKALDPAAAPVQHREKQAALPEPVQELGRWEHATRTPAVLQEAAARLQPRHAQAELPSQQAVQRTGRRPGASCMELTNWPTNATVPRSSTPLFSLRQAASPQPTHPSPSSRTPLVLHRQPASPPKQSPTLGCVSRGELPADLLSLRESATLQRRHSSSDRSLHSNQEQASPSRECSAEMETGHEPYNATLLAAPVRDATTRLLAVRRKRNVASEFDEQVSVWDTLVAGSSKPQIGDTTLSRTHSTSHIPPQKDAAARTAATVQSSMLPLVTAALPRMMPRPKGQSQGTPVKPGRATQAMLRQQAAWGSLAGLTLEEVLTAKPSVASKTESQEDQENLPSPQARSRRANSPSALPLQLSPGAQSQQPPAGKLAAGQARRKTEPIIRVADDAAEDADLMQKLQRLHTDGHAALENAGGIQWSRPGSHRQHADASTASIVSQPSCELTSESSWQSAAAMADRSAPAESLSPGELGPLPTDSAGSTPTGRRRRGTWNFAAPKMAAVPEHVPVDAGAPAPAGCSQPVRGHLMGRSTVADRQDQAGGDGGSWSQLVSPQRSFSADVPTSHHLPPGHPIHHRLHSDGAFYSGDQSHLQRAAADMHTHAAAGPVLPALHSHHGWEHGNKHQQLLPHMQPAPYAQQASSWRQQLPAIAGYGPGNGVAATSSPAVHLYQPATIQRGLPPLFSSSSRQHGYL